ncbi:glycosyl transferase family 1 [Rhodospirillum rubrum]|nr:glycosyl transferase family 1 [Rhodospirillum rubrum]MBK1677804.1 glycosyl transferase family 1 [Rhodospirillum rubrum]
MPCARRRPRRHSAGHSRGARRALGVEEDKMAGLSRDRRKILHVFPSFEVGGAQIRFSRIIAGLGQDFEHGVIALNGNSDTLSRLPAGAPVRLLALDYDTKGGPGRLWRFRQTLSRERPDLLVTYNWGAIEWGLVNLLAPLCPHVDIEDGFGPDEAAGQLPRRVALRRLVYGRAQRVIVPSRVLERLARDRWKVPAERLCYLPNGVPVESFGAPPEASLVARLGIDRDQPVIGTLASLRPEKNLSRLIEAFRLAVCQPGRPGQLVIIGDGVERPALEAQAAAADLGARVIFTGALDRPARVLGALSHYALSSDTEQMPLSLIEAMAAGLPVAATDVGDVAEMVAPSNHPFVVGRSTEDLARSLAGLLEDAERAKAIGAENRARAFALFGEDKMIEAYRRVFRGQAPD